MVTLPQLSDVKTPERKKLIKEKVQLVSQEGDGLALRRE